MRNFLCVSAGILLALTTAGAALAADADADADAGRAKSSMCMSCHSFTKNGPNKLGPDLWNIVNRASASAPGFNYSPALKALKGRKWTTAELDKFLAAPTQYAPGTRMTYAVGNAQDRANLIAWLRTQSDAPAPKTKTKGK